MLGVPNISRMGASLLITLREGLEISLVLSILIAYMVKTGRQSEVRSVWLGAGAATLLCLIFGIVVHFTVDGLHGKSEQAVEGTIAVVACAVLTYMIFWMRKNSRTLGGELRAQVDQSTTVKALAAIAFVAVAREGFETALFLLSAETSGSSGSQVVFGGLIGLVISAVVGVYLYRVGNRVNLKSFFTWTGILLILFAAGLAGKAVHEFRELLGMESGFLIEPAWTIESGPLQSGTTYDFMKGLFGWASDPERIRVITYFGYLVPVLVAFLGRSKQQTSTAAVTKTPAAV
jgi:high-affinity iron transporter